MKTNFETQKFGEHRACVKVDLLGKAVYPSKVITRTQLTCPSGYKDAYAYYGMKGHNGEDWACYRGEGIYFEIDEPMTWRAHIERDYSNGLIVDVFSDKPFYFPKPPKPDGEMEMIKKEWEKNKGWLYIKFRYVHFLDTPLKEKDPVKFGTLLGRGDSSELSSGDHCHRGWKVRQGASWFSISADNGYYGGLPFDQLPFKTENIYVGDVVKTIKSAKRAISLAEIVIFQVKTFLQKLLKG